MRLYFLLLLPLLIHCSDAPKEEARTPVDNDSASLANQETQFNETEYNLSIGDDTLYGTLTIPKGESPYPAVIIIAGSGPTDRNGNSTIMQGKNNAYLMLAHLLAGQGIASVRYDKRGIGRSINAAPSEESLRLEFYINDVGAWIEKMNSDDRIGDVAIFGHSEGSLIGMLAAQEWPVNAYISAAGAALPADQILYEQLLSQSQEIADSAKVIMDKMKRGESVKRVNPMLITLFRPSVQPYLRSWFKYDPAEEIAKLDMPVLILQGSNDLQVDEGQARMLAKAYPKAELVIIDSMNHVFKEAPADRAQNIKAYTNPQLPLDPELEIALIDFLNNVIK